MAKLIQLTVEITEDEASEFAEFLKRIAFLDYRGFAKNEEGAYRMLYAGERIRTALAERGFSPR